MTTDFFVLILQEPVQNPLINVCEQICAYKSEVNITLPLSLLDFSSWHLVRITSCS
jgi:hypothetical protein